MSCTVDGSSIVLTGTVGDIYGEDADSFDSRDVRAALQAVGKNRRATVYLNSGGGICTEGPAIAALFKAHVGGVDVIVEGIAASAASVAACGAATIAMSLGAVWMLHEASGVTLGTAEEHKVAIEELRVLNASMAQVYAAKSGRPAAEVLAIMADETWLTADEALRLGFADKVLDDDEPASPSRFAYAEYKHAPRMLMAYQGRPAKLAKPPQAARPAAPPASKPPSPDAPADPAVIAEMCIAAEQYYMTAELIRDHVTIAQARTRLDVGGQVRAMVALVDRRPGITSDVSAQCLSGGVSVAHAREALFNAMADADEALPVDTKRLTGNGSPNGRQIAAESMVKQIERNHGPEAAAKARATLKERNKS